MRTDYQRDGEVVPFWARPIGVATFVFVYLSVHSILRGSFSGILGTDDMFENVFVQDFSLGYQVRQPPLYEWLLYGAQQVLGPTIWSFQIVKYACIFTAGWALYQVARRALPEARMAALAVFSYTLMYQIGFNLHEGVTHTSILIATSALSFWAWLRFLERGDVATALVLGVAIGLGMLSKHSYALVPLVLLVTSLILPRFRTLLRWRLLPLVFVVALLVYSPFLWWVTMEGERLLSSSLNTMQGEQSLGHLARVGVGEARLIWGVIGFGGILLAVMLLVFQRGLWSGLRSLWRMDRACDGPLTARDYGQFVLVYTVASVGIAMIAVLISGATYIKERHMHPLMLVFPLAMMALVAEREADQARRLRIFSLFILVLIAVVFAVRISGFIAPDKKFCGGYCRHMKPYDTLAERLAAVEPEVAQATLVALDDYTAGNLRASLPDARVSLLNYRPRGPVRQQCYLIKDAGDDVAPDFSAVSAQMLKVIGADRESLVGAPLLFGVPWPHSWKPGFRVTYFVVVQLKPETPVCRPLS
ncbi:glycosyltransferase family 39 protein [Polycladidibacter hongkongensis]|uniref:glycosyltransferase family 39 protein n=1 Tax=Polycladidibacter hongkongensis TaxID=1647556 RepID=UPI00082B31CE|nr:glycosyltransferase family 39 protein [Pseudovibrio hongkongensis]